MEMFLKNEKVCVSVEKEEFFCLKPTVNVELNKKTEQLNLIENSETAETFSWVYGSENIKLECLLHKVLNNWVFSSTLYANGSLGKVEWFKNSEYNTCAYFSQKCDGKGNVLKKRSMTESDTTSGTFFAPAPMCIPFCMQETENMVGISVVCHEGHYQMDCLKYNWDGGMSISVDYYNYTNVNNKYTLPDIVFFEGKNNYEILNKYSNFSFEAGYIALKRNCQFDWWKNIMFCGWGDQWIIGMEKVENIKSAATWDDAAVAERAKETSATPDTFSYAIAASTETEYSNMLKKIETMRIPYGTVIIDCKWQKNFGSMEVDNKKWSNLRFSIDNLHSKGKKVLLWLNFWDPEGLPEDECIMCNGKKFSVDPTSESYVLHLKQIIHYLLSAEKGCCNADGFKIDFVSVPNVENLKIHKSGVFGIELLKLRAEQIYNFAKAEKPDALISSQYVHPYLNNCLDVMRIGDYYAGNNDAAENLQKRVNTIKAVSPNVLIDTDSPGTGKRRDCLTYFKNSVKLGIPSIYGVEIYNGLFVPSDWETVKEYYNNYNKITFK